MPLSLDEIARIDRENAHSYERDRITERIPIWGLFYSLSTVYGLIGVQNINAQGQYLLAMYPLLVSCLAQHVYDTQISLQNGHGFLEMQEEQTKCTSGAQAFFKSLARKARGGNKKAMRRGFFSTSLLATTSLITHMQQDHINTFIILIVAAAELYSLGLIVFYLTNWKPMIRWFQKYITDDKQHI